MPALKVKPPRDFPSMNAELGVRGWFNADAAAPGLSIVPARYVLIGTIPANSVIRSARLITTTVVAPAGGTVDVVLSESPDVTSPAALFTAAALTPAGTVLSTGAGLGYRPNRSYVFARFNGTQATAGRWDVVVSYYAKAD
jgi:hypothetical protein